MKKSELSYKLKKLLEPCKYWPQEQKKAFMPVVEYASRLEENIKILEARIKRQEQPPLPSIFPEGSHMSRSFMSEPVVEDVLSRRHRIWIGIKRGEAETEGFKRMIKWMRLSESEAFEIYSEVEQEKLQESKITG